MIRTKAKDIKISNWWFNILMEVHEKQLEEVTRWMCSPLDVRAKEAGGN